MVHADIAVSQYVLSANIVRVNKSRMIYGME